MKSSKPAGKVKELGRQPCALCPRSPRRVLLHLLGCRALSLMLLHISTGPAKHFLWMWGLSLGSGLVGLPHRRGESRAGRRPIPTSIPHPTMQSGLGCLFTLGADGVNCCWSAEVRTPLAQYSRSLVVSLPLGGPSVSCCGRL